MQNERIEIPLVIGGENVETGKTAEVVMPHRKTHVLADVHQGGAAEVERAIEAAGEAWEDWSRMPWEERAAIFLRAAELLAGPWRSTLNASTMLGQSKTAHQAEIDAACEVIDFFRFNVEFMTRIYEEQPVSSPGRVEPHRVPAARGVRLRRLAVQLHGHRREPPRQRRADGQHGRLEAGRDRRLLGSLPDGAPPGSRSPAGSDQPRLRLGRDDRRRGPREPAPGGHPLHGLDRGLQLDVAHDRLERRQLPQLPAASSARPAARTSSSRTPRRTSTRSRRPSSAAHSSTRARNARPRRACTRRRTSGPSSRAARRPGGPRSRWATSPTSGTSWARSSTPSR